MDLGMVLQSLWADFCRQRQQKLAQRKPNLRCEDFPSRGISCAQARAQAGAKSKTGRSAVFIPSIHSTARCWTTAGDLLAPQTVKARN